MGAHVFASAAWGRTPEEAFRDAVDHARYMHGHGGYTGTIAEKGSFALFVLPPRQKAAKFEALVSAAGDNYAAYLRDEILRLERELVRVGSADKRDVRRRLAATQKQLAKEERALATLARHAGTLWPLVDRAAPLAHDKHAPAVAVEITSKPEIALWASRTPTGRKPKRGYRLFLYFGTASS